MVVVDVFVELELIDWLSCGKKLELLMIPGTDANGIENFSSREDSSASLLILH